VIQDGGIAGGTGGSLVISALGGQDLSGVNTYTGSTKITDNALLSLSGNGSIASSSGLILSGAGATFDISASRATRRSRTSAASPDRRSSSAPIRSPSARRTRPASPALSTAAAGW
jgi:hypothetical protein